ncbi:hypothetical protein M1523_01430 [Patescibacteria group bacterium]|nr:hypothetical protein [Patescibacteria group bacterium]MCL5091558.1 hypothetical protein [Patescibacteria group bacterium]
MKKPTVFVTLNLVLLLILFSLLSNQNRVDTKVLGVFQSSATRDVAVSVGIGGYRFTLSGYTSPRALVTIQGMGIYDQTYADAANGYFEFTNSFSPFAPREACLTAQDQFGRLSAPLCLPPFETNRNMVIGPVLLPPTLSLDRDNYYVGDEVVLSGQSIPNSEINLSTFTTDNNPLSLVTPVEAATIPSVSAPTDSAGNYSVALPSASADNLRLFAQTDFLKQQSPQSITLNVRVLPVWMIILQFFAWIITLLKPRWMEIVISGQMIGLTIYLLRHFSHASKRRLMLVKREKYALMKSLR